MFALECVADAREFVFELGEQCGSALKGRVAHQRFQLLADRGQPVRAMTMLPAAALAAVR